MSATAEGPGEPVVSRHSLRSLLNQPGVDRLRAWVSAHDRRPELPLDDQTALFADRRITSLDLPELIMLLEELREAAVEVDSITPQSFASIEAIATTYLS